MESKIKEQKIKKIQISETKMLEIYFADLTTEAQNGVLEFYGMIDSSEGNFEISPLAIIEVEIDQDDELLLKK